MLHITMQEGYRYIFLGRRDHEILMGERSTAVVARFAYNEGSASQLRFLFSIFLF